MSNDDKYSAQHWDDLSSMELRLLIKNNKPPSNTSRELYSAEQCIQELDHALQQAEQKDPQYLSKQLDSLDFQTSNISFLIEAVDVLLKCTDESIFEHYESTITNTIICMDKRFDTLTCLMNNIKDHLEYIELNQVVIAQWQQHSEKVKEGDESLFFNRPPHIADTPYYTADTPFTEHLLFFLSARPTSLDSPSFSSKIPTGLLAYNPEHDGDPGGITVACRFSIGSLFQRSRFQLWPYQLFPLPPRKT
ncbi:hypothetical protein QOT17_019881 [Balamuthia mandrillaris]